MTEVALSQRFIPNLFSRGNISLSNQPAFQRKRSRADSDESKDEEGPPNSKRRDLQDVFGPGERSMQCLPARSLDNPVRHLPQPLPCIREKGQTREIVDLDSLGYSNPAQPADMGSLEPGRIDEKEFLANSTDSFTVSSPDLSNFQSFLSEEYLQKLQSGNNDVSSERLVADFPVIDPSLQIHVDQSENRQVGISSGPSFMDNGEGRSVEFNN